MAGLSNSRRGRSHVRSCIHNARAQFWRGVFESKSGKSGGDDTRPVRAFVARARNSIAVHRTRHASDQIAGRSQCRCRKPKSRGARGLQRDQRQWKAVRGHGSIPRRSASELRDVHGLGKPVAVDLEAGRVEGIGSLGVCRIVRLACGCSLVCASGGWFRRGKTSQ